MGAASPAGLPWPPRPPAPPSQTRREGRAVSPLACGGPSAWHRQPGPVPAAAGPGAGSGPPAAAGPASPPGGPTGPAGPGAPPRPPPPPPSGSGGLWRGPGGCCGSCEGAGTGGGSGDRGGQPGGGASGTRRSLRRAGGPAGSWRVGRKKPSDRGHGHLPGHRGGPGAQGGAESGPGHGVGRGEGGLPPLPCHAHPGGQAVGPPGQRRLQRGADGPRPFLPGPAPPPPHRALPRPGYSGGVPLGTWRWVGGRESQGSQGQSPSWAMDPSPVRTRLETGAQPGRPWRWLWAGPHLSRGRPCS